MKKYYFISYQVGEPYNTFFNECINKHPIEWQLEMHAKYRDQKPIYQCDRITNPSQSYVLLWWVEITKAEYEEGIKIEY